MGTLMRRMGGALSVFSNGTENYSKLAERGVDFRAITPVMTAEMPSHAPELVHDLELMPAELGQDIAAKARETAEEMGVNARIAKDILDDQKKMIDAAVELDNLQLQLSTHAAKAQDKMAGNRVKHELTRNAQTYGRARMAATLFGNEKGYKPTAMQRLFAR